VPAGDDPIYAVNHPPSRSMTGRLMPEPGATFKADREIMKSAAGTYTSGG